MVVIPKFGGDENFFTSNETLGNCTTNTFTGFLFVLIVVGTVEEAITSLDSLEEDFRTAFQNSYFSGIPTVYTVSAAVAFSTFQNLKPTKGISRPEASATVILAVVDPN